MKVISTIGAGALMCVGMAMLSSCGGNGVGMPSPEPTPAPDFSIGGTVSGLAGASSAITLEDNGGDAMTVTSNGAFVFPKKIQGGDAYDVTIASEPTNPPQNCTVGSAKGTVAGDVTSVTVTCGAPAQYTVSGVIENLTGTNSGLTLQVNGGTLLTAQGSGAFVFTNTVEIDEAYDVTIAQQPNSPTQICSVANGQGVATANVTNVVIDCGHKEWAWISGSTANGQQGLYGTMGVANAQNIPGARQDSATWVDAEGNLWLFGGFGLDSIGTLDQLNDLWKFNGGEWTWMGGSNLTLGSASYGTKGTASASNIPGARFTATFAKDRNGNVWLFGGWGIPAVGGESYLNDLWKFSDGKWTWMGGSNISSQNGTYGTQGVAAAGNAPGGRYQAVSWVDTAGNFWLFGGLGLDATGNLGLLNDLWEFSNGQWTWVSGSTAINQPGIYGTPSFPSPTNVPGARSEAVAWSDSFGNMWLFGGDGYAAAGSGPLDDLWEFANGGWIWQGGSSSAFESANYGTQGVLAGSNNPGSIELASGAVDANGNFWMFGGSANGFMGDLNNLWELRPGGWTWWTGSGLTVTAGVYGTKGFFAPSNVVGARSDTMTWVDASGNVWVFGGNGYDSTGTHGYLNDLWEYKF